MPLFSVIGLLIAVFGATYTAISAFRAHYNPIISEHVKQAPDKVLSIRKLRGNADGDANQIYYDKMLFAFRLWHWFSIGPIGLFLFFAFSLSAWLFFHWADVGAPFDSEYCRYYLAANWVLNLIAIAGSFGSYYRVRNKNFILTQNYQLAGKSAVGPANGEIMQGTQ
jgi:hypothetical protein